MWYGAVVNWDDGENDPWHGNINFDFSSICIKLFIVWDVCDDVRLLSFEAKLAFPNSTSPKWSSQHKDLSK